MPRSSRLAAVLVPPALLIGAVGAAVAATPGVVTEYPSNTGSIPSGGIGVAPNGTVYGVFNNLNTVVPFTSSGTGGQVSVAAGGNLVSSIAPGPDGAMWMTYNFTSTLGRLDTASGTTTQVGGLSSAGWSSSAGRSHPRPSTANRPASNLYFWMIASLTAVARSRESLRTISGGTAPRIEASVCPSITIRALPNCLASVAASSSTMSTCGS